MCIGLYGYYLLKIIGIGKFGLEESRLDGLIDL